MSLKLPSKSFVDLYSSVTIVDFHFPRFAVGFILIIFLVAVVALVIMFKNTIKAGDCKGSQLITLGRN